MPRNFVGKSSDSRAPITPPNGTGGVFLPANRLCPLAGDVFDADELESLVDCSLDFWLTSGRFAETFEREFARQMGVRSALLVNSGSSANLLALTALTDESLGTRRLRPGDEVITLAAGFPTTVNPIIQNRCLPVFVDVELGTYNIDVGALEQRSRRRPRPSSLHIRLAIRSTSTVCWRSRKRTIYG